MYTFAESNSLCDIDYYFLNYFGGEIPWLRCDVYRVSAVVGNGGYLPTYLTREAVKLGVDVKPTAVLSGAEMIEGKAEQTVDHLQGYSGISAKYIWSVPGTGAHEPVQRKISWMVRGSAGTEITVSISCPSSGKASAAVTL